MNDGRTKINVQDEFRGDTALIYNISAESQEEDTANVAVILKHNPKLEIHNNDGYTALMTAIKKENYTVAEMLLEAGADVKTKTPIGDAFKMAEGKKKFLSLLEMFDYDEDYEEK